jgi:4a-hydroxytetrahydrobiopterin dehydratase
MFQTKIRARLSAAAVRMPLMDETTQPDQPRLTRREISDAVTELGWRFILGTLQTYVLVGSLAEAARVVASVTSVTGGQADQSLRADVRADRVVLTLQSAVTGWVTRPEIDLAGQISALITGLGLKTSADGGPAGPAPATRTVQGLEIGIDALDIPAIRPFWHAVLGYVDEPGQDGPPNGLVDPVGQGPAVWFQQMDAPRPQRNRIHFDVSVPQDEAADRIAAALAAGGRLLSDAEAPAFWVLADPEGNEACVCTWQGRDA